MGGSVRTGGSRHLSVDGDGASGIKWIKEAGGMTVAQRSDEARHEGMPRSAIATGMVDWVLRVAEMPQRLLENLRKARSVKAD
jgi:two-component system CheB/CheR fusion protein